MAVDFKVQHTRTSEYLFAPEDITVDPALNGRHDLPPIDGLAQSILSIGQQQPVVIRNDGGKPALVAGFSRWRAVIHINKGGLAPVPLKLRCVYFRGSAQEGFLANIAENRERNQTTPMDDAHNIARLERYGLTHEEIAKVYRESAGWVKDRLALLDLTEESRDALREGRLKPTAATHIAKLSAEQQRKAVAGKSKVTVRDAKVASGAKQKASMRDVRNLIGDILLHEKFPKGLNKSSSVEQVLQYFADAIDGEATVKAKAA